MARFSCPGCGSLFEVEPRHVGKIVRCPSCGEALGTSAGPPAGPAPGPTPLGEARPAGAWPPAAAPAPWAGPPGYPPMQPPGAPRPLSRAGVASFVLGLLFWMGWTAVGVKLAMPLMRGGRAPSPAAIRAYQEQLAKHPPAWLAPAFVLLGGLTLAGLALGIYAATRPGGRKGFATAGLILCGLGLCCGAGNLLGRIGGG